MSSRAPAIPGPRAGANTPSADTRRARCALWRPGSGADSRGDGRSAPHPGGSAHGNRDASICTARTSRVIGPRAPRPCSFSRAEPIHAWRRHSRRGPLVFPWFGAHTGHPSAPDHGFARIAEWTVESVDRVGDGVDDHARARASDATRATGPPSSADLSRAGPGDARAHARGREPPTTPSPSRRRCTRTSPSATCERVGARAGGPAYVDKTDGMRRKARGRPVARAARPTGSSSARRARARWPIPSSAGG